MKPSEEQIKSLPKWTQEHIKRLETSLLLANAAVVEFVSEQKQSPIYLDAWYCEPRVKKYINSPTNRVTIEHADVRAEIFCAPRNDGQRLFGIEIAFSQSGQSLTSNIAVIPASYSTIQLVHPKNLHQ